MELANFDETLRTFKRRTPFRPFTVALVNGDRFEVDHPEALLVRDGGGRLPRAGRRPGGL